MIATGAITGETLNTEQLRKIDAYWRAANYLSVGQIYLLDNPLLKEPLKSEADILYSKLENIIIPMYYHNRDAYIDIMRNAIAINGSFFNTERMISQYVTKAYFR